MALEDGKGAIRARTQSCFVTGIARGSHDFIVHGYSLSKGIGSGRFITSDQFSVGGYQWAIYFYPDGKSSKDNSSYVSIYIGLIDAPTDAVQVRAFFELALHDTSINAKHKVCHNNVPHMLNHGNSQWGLRYFIRRELLETSNFLKNDTLLISCKVEVISSSLQGPCQAHCIQVPKPDLTQHFGALFSEESGATFGQDVTFDVKGEVFQAHKLVLAARSPVFRVQLFGSMCDRNTNKIHIEDMEPPIFKAMLHFIYKDVLPDHLSTVMVQHLFVAADRYGLERLHRMCESMLCEDVAIDTVCTTLALAEQHQNSRLKAVCLNYASANIVHIMESEGFQHLRDSCSSVLEELLQMVAGMYVPRNTSVWVQVSDGSDAYGRRVRPRCS